MSEKYYDEYCEGGTHTPDNSGETKSPLDVEPQPEITDYTNPQHLGYEYSDMFGSNEYSKSISKDTGIDLNDGNSDFNGNTEKNPVDNSLGIDLNDTGTEQLDSVLDNFQGDKWGDLSLNEQKQSMTELADYVAADTGNKNPPEIVFFDDMADGTYGGYNPATNTIEINENMLDNSTEAADTIAHEMWHAYQQQEASNPNSEKGREYQEGFDNYISPEYDFEGYQNQMVEAEARDYAQGFKDRIIGAI